MIEKSSIEDKPKNDNNNYYYGQNIFEEKKSPDNSNFNLSKKSTEKKLEIKLSEKDFNRKLDEHKNNSKKNLYEKIEDTNLITTNKNDYYNNGNNQDYTYKEKVDNNKMINEILTGKQDNDYNNYNIISAVYTDNKTKIKDNNNYYDNNDNKSGSMSDNQDYNNNGYGYNYNNYNYQKNFNNNSNSNNNNNYNYNNNKKSNETNIVSNDSSNKEKENVVKKESRSASALKKRLDNRVVYSKTDDEKTKYMVDKYSPITKSKAIDRKVKMLEEILMRNGQQENGDNSQNNYEVTYNENGSSLNDVIDRKPIDTNKRKKSRISFDESEEDMR